MERDRRGGPFAHRHGTVKSTAGFTLIETMVTVAVIAITASMFVPAMQTFVANNRLISVANGLVSDLSLARSEAIRRAATVTVCQSTSGTGCNNSAWTSGWIVFVDVNGSGSVDTGDTILKISRGTSNTLATVAQGGFSTAGYVQFNSSGESNSGTGTFTVCQSKYNTQQITVSGTGRVSPATLGICP
jgi:type IV fimbrial biogenesis protein FimT